MSVNVYENGVLKQIAGGGETVDDALSNTSTNPVQNKVIKESLNKKLSTSGGIMTGTIESTVNLGSWINTAAGLAIIKSTIPNPDGRLLALATLKCINGRFVIGTIRNQFILAHIPEENIDNGVNEKDYVVELLNEDGSANFPGILRARNFNGGYIISGKRVGTTIGDNATAEGKDTIASSYQAHAEGLETTASANRSHAEGWKTTASGVDSHAEGYATIASAHCSHAEGNSSKSLEMYSHAEGLYTQALAKYSHTGGIGTIADYNSSTAIGSYNVRYNNSNGLFIIGNGTAETPSNAFRVASNGTAYGKAAYNSSGADYAEYFEWEDGNSNNEDRRGYFVTLSGDKIKIASPDDDYILGIVSANPVVIGNSDPDNWHDRFLKDEFGNYIMKTVTEKIPTGEDTFEEIETKSYVLNPEFDESLDKDYIPRSDRPEWAPVGMLGQLIVRDDGSCRVNGYCTIADGGIATDRENAMIDALNPKNTSTSYTGYRVIKRISDNLIKIIFR